jgi:hypothetical protein
MITNRFAKSVVTAALVAGTLGLATIVGTGAAHADSVDDTFVATLAQAGIPQIKPELEIAAGHAVCQNLDEGTTNPDRVLASFVAKRVFATYEQNRTMVVASMTAYCPQYLPQLHS